MLLKGIAREKKTRIKQAAAFTLAAFKRTSKSIDVSTLTGLRNRALLLGFTGTFWRSELEALNIEHLAFDEAGLVVSLDQSKTNQLGQAGEKLSSIRLMWRCAPFARSWLGCAYSTEPKAACSTIGRSYEANAWTKLLERHQLFVTATTGVASLCEVKTRLGTAPTSRPA